MIPNNVRPLSAPAVLLLLGWVGSAPDADVSDPATVGEWHHYAADRASTKYSPLDQINPSNVDRLREVWRWTSVETEADTEYSGGAYKSTALYIDGALYVTTSLSQVAALDPATGETRWVYDPRSYDAGRPANAGFQQRGLEYWSGEIDGEPVERLIYAAHHRRLISLDLMTGAPDPAFGDGGMVNTALGLGREINERQYTHSAPPIVCADVIVLGSIISDGPRGPKMPPGHVRGYDVRTGEMRWIFRTIPQPGEFGNETWLDGSWEYSGNTNVWTMMSCDDELGMVYLPVSTPTNDWYGGHRPGDNLFAESLVALDARTGERKWHFQAVHHGLWDYDFGSAPNLIDITVNGREIKAVAQVSKQGITYVFDRVTGEPVWPIDELPVPQTTVPAEWSSPTQPMPTRPPPFERLGLTEDDLIDFTPELRAEALEMVKDYVLGPIFTPPLEVKEGGKLGVLTLPSAAGGANWRGAAVDPEAGVLYVPSMTPGAELRRAGGRPRPLRVPLRRRHLVHGRTSGPASREAAVQPDHRDRPEHRRAPVAGRPRPRPEGPPCDCAPRSARPGQPLPRRALQRRSGADQGPDLHHPGRLRHQPDDLHGRCRVHPRLRQTRRRQALGAPCGTDAARHADDLSARGPAVRGVHCGPRGTKSGTGGVGVGVSPMAARRYGALGTRASCPHPARSGHWVRRPSGRHQARCRQAASPSRRLARLHRRCLPAYCSQRP